MTGMIERLQHYGLWLALRTWSRRVKEAQTQRREEEWRNDVMLRTITRIMTGMKASAFATWAGQIACHHRARSLMLRTINRIVFGIKASAFATWVSEIARHHQAHRLMRRTVLRLRHALVAMAFSQWLASVTQARAEISLQKRQHMLKAKIVARLQGGIISRAWCTWQNHAREEARKRNLIRQVLMRLQCRRLTTVWNSWVFEVEGARSRKLEEQRKQNVSMRIIKRMMHSALASAFTCWVDHTARAQRAVSMTARVLGRWRHRHRGTLLTKTKTNSQTLTMLADLPANPGIAFRMWCEAVKDGTRLRRAAIKVVICKKLPQAPFPRNVLKGHPVN